MRNNPKLKIQIEGHICCLMNKNVDGYDYDTGEHLLSENRAKAIYDYLAEKGIDTGRMKYIGLSNTKPLRWPEDTGEDQDMNRRVEIRILEK